MRPAFGTILPVSGFAAHVGDGEDLDFIAAHAKGQRVAELPNFHLAEVFFKTTEDERLTTCPVESQAKGKLEEFALLRIITFDVSTSLKKLFPRFGMKTKVQHFH